MCLGFWRQKGKTQLPLEAWTIMPFAVIFGTLPSLCLWMDWGGSQEEAPSPRDVTLTSPPTTHLPPWPSSGLAGSWQSPADSL